MTTKTPKTPEPRATPAPGSTDWVPIWGLGQGASYVPPVVNGQWLKGVGGAAVWSPITPADVGLPKITFTGTTPPSAPADGDIWIMGFTPNQYVGAPGYSRWTFQWSASSAVWFFIGGPPVHADYDSASGTASGTGVDLGGPYIYVPRPGAYLLEFGCTCTPNVGGVANAYMSIVKISDGSALYGVGVELYNCPTGGYVRAMSRATREGVVAAGDGFHTRYSVSNAQSVNFQSRYLRIVPRYVT